MRLFPIKVRPDIVKFVKEKYETELKDYHFKWRLLRRMVKEKFGVDLSASTLKRIAYGEYDNLIK